MNGGAILAQEAVFFLLACACLAWAQWRLPAGVAAFPGPRPVGPVFKVWLLIIWGVGLVLPLLALVVMLACVSDRCSPTSI